jgi:uracil-DNA glycosylase
MCSASSLVCPELRVAIVQPLKGHQQIIVVDGKEILTLEDILPPNPGLRVLFVGKTPAPDSVEIGHYFQGKQGAQFWSRLRQFGLLTPRTEFEDDSLLDCGYGLTDIAKVPHPPGEEPFDREYTEGSSRILELIQIHRPSIVVFVYKKALDKMARFQFGIGKKSTYGFNNSLETHFGTHVFAFPLPGVPCKSAEAEIVMKELVNECK